MLDNDTNEAGFMSEEQRRAQNLEILFLTVKQSKEEAFAMFKNDFNKSIDDLIKDQIEKNELLDSYGVITKKLNSEKVIAGREIYNEIKERMEKLDPTLLSPSEERDYI